MSRKKADPIVFFGTPATRRQFLKYSAGAVGSLSIAGYLAACGGDDDGGGGGGGGGGGAAAPKTSEAKFQVRWLLDVGFAGFFAAQEKGYWADEGLDIEILAGGPNIDVQQVVSGGGVPLGEGITDRIIRGRIEQNVPMRVFAAMYQVPPSSFITFEEDNIRGPEDFVGKRLATTPEGVPLDKAMMARNGLDPNSIKFVPSGFDPTPLVEGKADIFQGFCTDQGLRLELEGRKIHCVTYLDMGYEMYDGPLFALDEMFEQDEDLLVRFLRGSIKGWEYNQKNPDEVAEFVVSKYGVKGLELEFQKAQNRAQLPFVMTEETPRMMDMTEERWQNTIDFLVEAKTVSKSIPASDIMTTDILDKAYGGKTSLLEA